MSGDEEWHELCAEDDVADGQVAVSQLAGHELAVVRVGAELFCIDAICSHALGYLDEGEVDGYEIECPLHGGRFDVRTGAPTQEPAELPIGTYPLRSQGGRVYVRVER